MYTGNFTKMPIYNVGLHTRRAQNHQNLHNTSVNKNNSDI